MARLRHLGVRIDAPTLASLGSGAHLSEGREGTLVQLAAKLLSAVEVSADLSHQHEFHAGRLRTALGFAPGTFTGDLNLTFFPGEAGEPDGETCSYTLYNSRDEKPRAPEYRLYFDSTTLQERAREGDILIILRADDDANLNAVVVASTSLLGQEISKVLSDDGIELKQQFKTITTAIRSSDVAHLLGEAADKAIVPDADVILAAANPSFLADAIRRGALPSTKEMSAEAVRILTQVWPGTLDPDGQLFWSLEAETALFGHLEEELGQRALNDLAAEGEISFAAATALVLGRLQSRKSRRGQSLQNHFAAVLHRFQIPFGAQCRTEHGETPDFMIPGCAEYSDPSFPATQLRMVACKSTVKERWGQILKEAERIPGKYLLTLDEALTDDGVARMLNSDLTVFLPKPIIERAYAASPIRNRVETVSALVNRLQAARRRAA